MNSNTKILDIFLKIIFLILFFLILIWIFPTRGTIEKKLNNLESKIKFEIVEKELNILTDRIFLENINNMKEVSISYFTNSRLPSKIGDSKEITLEEMLDKKLLLEFKDANGNSCDSSNSYARITKNSDEYHLKVNLKCDSFEDYVVVSLGCENYCDRTIETKTQTINTTIYQTINPSSGNTQTPAEEQKEEINKVLYYQYAKLNTTYSDWHSGYKTGNNIENDYRKVNYNYYYKLEFPKYYTTTYITKYNYNNLKNNKGVYTYSYIFRLSEIPQNTTRVRINGATYFKNSDYQIYLDNRYLNYDENTRNIYINNKTSFKNSSLKSSNFSYSFSKPYQGTNGYWYTIITVNVRNLNNVSTYYSSYLDEEIYFVPIYFYLEYTDENNYIIDKDDNWANHSSSEIRFAYSKYEDVYRYIYEDIDYNDLIWSSEKSINGYVKTGLKEWR